MYCVNEFIVRLLVITVLLSLLKITDLLRKMYKHFLDLEIFDSRFDLICQCQSENKPVG